MTVAASTIRTAAAISAIGVIMPLGRHIIACCFRHHRSDRDACADSLDT